MERPSDLAQEFAPISNGATTWRLFIALRFPSEIKRECEKLMSRLRAGIQFTGAHPAWVKAESLHMTLAFLGATPLSKISDIERIMSAATQGVSPLSLTLGRLTLFPTDRNPRVIALHLRGEIGGVQRVQETLSDGLTEAGFRLDQRPFRPHVTLARIKSMRGLAGLRDVVAAHQSADVGNFVAGCLTLYRSHLLPDGAEYEIIYEAPFASR